MIIQTVDVYQFSKAFLDSRPNNFSYEGLACLFDYLDQLSDDCGEPLELDVIAICCEFSEDTADNIAKYYSIDLTECETADERADAVREHLEDEGAYVGECLDHAGATLFVYRNY